MTWQPLWLAFSLFFAGLAVSLTLWLDHQVDQAEDRLDRLECVHRIYEDGSTVHEDAEVVSRFCPEALP
jgi:hypothetical protein